MTQGTNYEHEYNLVWNSHFWGTTRGVHIQHWYRATDGAGVDGGFCLCGIDGVRMWTAAECRQARQAGGGPDGEPVDDKKALPDVPDNPSVDVWPSCPACLVEWLRYLEREGTSFKAPSWWARRRPTEPNHQSRYMLVWNPVGFDGIGPGKIHVQVWTRARGKWIRERLLDGRKGSGYMNAEDCRHSPGAPTIPSEPSNVNLPTCTQCGVRWLRILEREGIEVPEELRSWYEPEPSPYAGDRHEAYLRTSGAGRLCTD